MRTPDKPIKDTIVTATVKQAVERAAGSGRSVVLVAHNSHVTQLSDALQGTPVRFAELNWGTPAIERQEVTASFDRGELDVLLVVTDSADHFLTRLDDKTTVLIPVPLSYDKAQLSARLARDPR